MAKAQNASSSSYVSFRRRPPAVSSAGLGEVACRYGSDGLARGPVGAEDQCPGLGMGSSSRVCWSIRGTSATARSNHHRNDVPDHDYFQGRPSSN